MGDAYEAMDATRRNANLSPTPIMDKALRLIDELLTIIDGTPGMPWQNIVGGTDNPTLVSARIFVARRGVEGADPMSADPSYDLWIRAVYEYEVALGGLPWWRRLLGQRPPEPPNYSLYPPITPTPSEES